MVFLNKSKAVARLVRHASGVTAFVFFLTSTAGAAPLLPSPEFTPPVAISLSPVQIPVEWAHIEKTVGNFEEGKPQVVYIQDAHSNYDAQKSTQALLKHLHENEGFDLALIEGAASKLDAGRLRYFPDLATDQKIADTLARRGHVNGAELYLLEGASDFSVRGIEDKNLYASNVKAFRRVIEAAPKSEAFITALRSELDRFTTQLLNRSLRDFVRKHEAYRSSNLDMRHFIAVLAEEAKKALNIDLTGAASQIDYPQLHRLNLLSKPQDEINEKKLTEEWNTLSAKLKDWGVGEDTIQSLNVTVSAAVGNGLKPFPADTVSPRKLLERLYQETVEKGFGFENFPLFTQYMKRIVIQDELNPIALSKEMESLSGKVREALITNDAERNALAFLDDVFLVEQAVTLSLEKDKLDRFRDRIDSLEFTRLTDRLAGLARDAHLSIEHAEKFSKASSKLNGLLGAVNAFYSGTEARDRKMTENVLAVMKKEGKTKAVLITGGFHTAPLGKQLEDRGVSYLVVTPHIKELDLNRTNYYRTMMQDNNFKTSHIMPTVWAQEGFNGTFTLTGGDIDYLAGEYLTAFTDVATSNGLTVPQILSFDRGNTTGIVDGSQVTFTQNNRSVSIAHPTAGSREIVSAAGFGKPDDIDDGWKDKEKPLVDEKRKQPQVDAETPVSSKPAADGVDRSTEGGHVAGGEGFGAYQVEPLVRGGKTRFNLDTTIEFIAMQAREVRREAYRVFVIGASPFTKDEPLMRLLVARIKAKLSADAVQILHPTLDVNTPIGEKTKVVISYVLAGSEKQSLAAVNDKNADLRIYVASDSTVSAIAPTATFFAQTVGPQIRDFFTILRTKPDVVLTLTPAERKALGFGVGQEGAGWRDFVRALAIVEAGIQKSGGPSVTYIRDPQQTNGTGIRIELPKNHRLDAEWTTLFKIADRQEFLNTANPLNLNERTIHIPKELKLAEAALSDIQTLAAANLSEPEVAKALAAYAQTGWDADVRAAALDMLSVHGFPDESTFDVVIGILNNSAASIQEKGLAIKAWQGLSKREPGFEGLYVDLFGASISKRPLVGGIKLVGNIFTVLLYDTEGVREIEFDRAPEQKEFYTGTLRTQASRDELTAVLNALTHVAADSSQQAPAWVHDVIGEIRFYADRYGISLGFGTTAFKEVVKPISAEEMKKGFYIDKTVRLTVDEKSYFVVYDHKTALYEISAFLPSGNIQALSNDERVALDRQVTVRMVRMWGVAALTQIISNSPDSVTVSAEQYLWGGQVEALELINEAVIRNQLPGTPGFNLEDAIRRRKFHDAFFIIQTGIQDGTFPRSKKTLELEAHLRSLSNSAGENGFGRAVKVRSDILKKYKKPLFGQRQANNKLFITEKVIAQLTDLVGRDLAIVLAERSHFQEQVSIGKAKYTFPDMNANVSDVDGNVRTNRQIAQGMIDNFFGNKTNERWALNEETPIPDYLNPDLNPGLEGTGPADDLGMAMSALNAATASWMWDWEDAGNDFEDKLYQAWVNLKEILRGTWTNQPFHHEGKKKNYQINLPRKNWASIYHRVPGLHLTNRQISLDDKQVPGMVAAMVIHTLNNYGSLKRVGQTVAFYVPKIETPEEALVVAKLLNALEKLLGVSRGTIKIKMLNERARYAANQVPIMWVLRHWLIGPNVGRWDYINSLIEMFKDDPAAVFPNAHGITMTADIMAEYTRRNALLTLLAGGKPTGGMSAVMKMSGATVEQNASAVRSIWFDKLRERLLGLFLIDGRLYDTYRQSWVATTEEEYVRAGEEPLKVPYAELKTLVGRLSVSERDTLKGLGLIDENGGITPLTLRREDITVENLFSSAAWHNLFHKPAGKITENGLRYAIYMASEYMFQQLNGNNAAAIDDLVEVDGKLAPKGTRLMNDFATYEIFWHWLWTTVQHSATLDADGEFSKKGDKVTPALIMSLLNERRQAVDDYFARTPDNGRFDRTKAPLVMDLLERQLFHKRWITYGSRVLLSIVEADDAQREKNLDAIFSDSRDDVVAKVASGALNAEALRAHDYVYDIFEPATGFGASAGDEARVDPRYTGVLNRLVYILDTQIAAGAFDAPEAEIAFGSTKDGIPATLAQVGFMAGIQATMDQIYPEGTITIRMPPSKLLGSTHAFSGTFFDLAERVKTLGGQAKMRRLPDRRDQLVLTMPLTIYPIYEAVKKGYEARRKGHESAGTQSMLKLFYQISQTGNAKINFRDTPKSSATSDTVSIQVKRSKGAKDDFSKSFRKLIAIARAFGGSGSARHRSELTLTLPVHLYGVVKKGVEEGFKDINASKDAAGFGFQNVAEVRKFMNDPRFARINRLAKEGIGGRIWTAEDILTISSDVEEGHRLHNMMADALYDLIGRHAAAKTFAATGGAMDGPTAAAMAEAGLEAIYLSGWQASHHWGQPDLAKYPLDTVPKVIEAIYKYLRNKHDDQKIRFSDIKSDLELVFNDLFEAIRTKDESELAGIKSEFVTRLMKAVTTEDGKKGRNLSIFKTEWRDQAADLSKALFESIVADAFAGKGTSTSESRSALRKKAIDTLEANLVNYLIPVFADGDTGHLSVKELVRLFVKSNAAGIHLEDQAHGCKKCGHMSGKVLTSTAEHYLRLLEAAKERDKLGSKLVIIARTDAEAAKLLKSIESASDHYFVKGVSRSDIPSYASIIQLMRREAEEYVRGFENKTYEEAVTDLEKQFPELARQIRVIWQLRGEVNGRRISPEDTFKYTAADFTLTYSEHETTAEEIWNNRESIMYGEDSLGLETVLTDSEGKSYTVADILNRKPKRLKDEIAAVNKLGDIWTALAKPKTFVNAVAEEILSNQSDPNREAIAARWREATDPLKRTLSIDQLRELASREFGVDIYWDWEKAMTYEGYYQIDEKLGLVNAAVRSRIFAKIADVIWMEQDGPNVHHAEEFITNVKNSPTGKDVHFSINLSPSFNWSAAKGWKSSFKRHGEEKGLSGEALTTFVDTRIANINKAMSVKEFDWENPATWGTYAEDVQAMQDEIMSFSARMGTLGFSFQFVTIFQDHTSSLAIYRTAQELKKHGAGGYVRNVQQQEQKHGARFEQHQAAAGVGRVTAEDDTHFRGASNTSAGGKDSTEGQFAKPVAGFGATHFQTHRRSILTLESDGEAAIHAHGSYRFTIKDIRGGREESYHVSLRERELQVFKLTSNGDVERVDDGTNYLFSDHVHAMSESHPGQIRISFDLPGGELLIEEYLWAGQVEALGLLEEIKNHQAPDANGTQSSVPSLYDLSKLRQDIYRRDFQELLSHFEDIFLARAEAEPKEYAWVPRVQGAMRQLVLADFNFHFGVTDSVPQAIQAKNRENPKRLDGTVRPDGSVVRVYTELSELPDDPRLKELWDDHYAVFEIDNRHLGFTAYISIHRLTQIRSRSVILDGQWRSTGGTRMIRYADGKFGALRDSAELGKEMSYKDAGGELRIGGSKSAIHVEGFDPSGESPEKDAVLRSYAETIEWIGQQIGGGILTGQDMNISVRNALLMFRYAPTSIVPYVAGSLSRAPTEPTAAGIVAAIRAATEAVFSDAPTLEGKVVSVQGLGGVGGLEILPLLKAGAIVIGADVRQSRIDALLSREPELHDYIAQGKLFLFTEEKRSDGSYTSKIANPLAHFPGLRDKLGITHVDIFSPSAAGGAINDETIPELAAARVKVIVGSANDVTRDKKKHPKALADLGILFIPDYRANAGGVLAVNAHLGREATEEAIAKYIYASIKELIRASREAGITPQEYADAQAAQFIAALPAARKTVLIRESTTISSDGALLVPVAGFGVEIDVDWERGPDGFPVPIARGGQIPPTKAASPLATYVTRNEGPLAQSWTAHVLSFDTNEMTLLLESDFGSAVPSARKIRRLQFDRTQVKFFDVIENDMATTEASLGTFELLAAQGAVRKAVDEGGPAVRKSAELFISVLATYALRHNGGFGATDDRKAIMPIKRKLSALFHTLHASTDRSEAIWERSAKDLKTHVERREWAQALDKFKWLVENAENTMSPNVADNLTRTPWNEIAELNAQLEILKTMSTTRQRSARSAKKDFGVQLPNRLVETLSPSAIITPNGVLPVPAFAARFITPETAVGALGVTSGFAALADVNYDRATTEFIMEVFGVTQSEAGELHDKLLNGLTPEVIHRANRHQALVNGTPVMQSPVALAIEGGVLGADYASLDTQFSRLSEGSGVFIFGANDPKLMQIVSKYTRPQGGKRGITVRKVSDLGVVQKFAAQNGIKPENVGIVFSDEKLVASGAIKDFALAVRFNSRDFREYRLAGTYLLKDFLPALALSKELQQVAFVRWDSVIQNSGHGYYQVMVEVLARLYEARIAEELTAASA